MQHSRNHDIEEIRICRKKHRTTRVDCIGINWTHTAPHRSITQKGLVLRMGSNASATTNLNSDTMSQVMCAQKVVDSALDLVARLENEQRKAVVHVVVKRLFSRYQSDSPQHAAVRRIV